ncbi:hypothetical protein EDD15DRAFT_2379118 [Pisolithus albus]|nr:hypothetical protein EDD15DRAFT_2379118 [Pisolithus albus]
MSLQNVAPGPELTGEKQVPQPPSHVAGPTTVTSAPQQGEQTLILGTACINQDMFVRSPLQHMPSINEAATAPASGNEVPVDQIRKPEEVDRDDPNIRVVELPPQRDPPFKEKVYGYARVIRGTALADPNIKEQGERVLRGEETIPRAGGSVSD